jgi:hypothetical protein
MRRSTIVVCSLATVVALGVGIAVWSWNRGPAPALGIPTVRTPAVPTRPVGQAACGWSVLDDGPAAARAAASMAKAQLGGARPLYAFVTFTVGYDCPQVIGEVRKALGSEVKIHGATSAIGVMTNEGFHRGPVGSIALLAVASQDVRYGVAGVNLSESATPEEAGAAVIRAAARDAGVPEDTVPQIVLMTGTTLRGGEMRIMDGIGRVIGADVPILGGNAGDEKHDGSWRQFTREATYANGLVVTAIYTARKVGWAFESGFRITDKAGTVTKSDGKTIYQIDGRPALEVYDEWLGGELLKTIQSKPQVDVVRLAASNPLCVVLKGASGQLGYRTSRPVPARESLKDMSLPVYAAIEEGSQIQMFSGSWQAVLNRAERAPKRAMIRGGIGPQDGTFGVLFFCKGLCTLIPASEMPKVPCLVGNPLGQTPFVGIVTIGEQGMLPGLRNVNCNLVESMVVLGGPGRK